MLDEVLQHFPDQTSGTHPVATNSGDDGGKAFWRELLYTIVISPKGRRYVQALPSEPADILHVGVCKTLAIPPVRFRRYELSETVTRMARRAGSLERGRAALDARQQQRQEQRDAVREAMQ